MSEIDVKIDNLRLTVPEIKRVSKKMDALSSQLTKIGDQLRSDSTEMQRIADLIHTISDKAETSSQRNAALATRLEDILNLYRETESQILNDGNGSKSTYDKASGKGETLLEKLRSIILAFLAAIGIVPGGTSNSTSEYAGEPVDMCIGSYVSDTNELLLSGDMDLRFMRHYNSRFPQQGTLGIGWSHNYEISLQFEGSSLVIVGGDGRRERFIPESENTYISSFGSYDNITKTNDSYIYCRKKGDTLLFDYSGKLTSVKNKAGYSLEFSYEDNRLSRVSAGQTRFIDYSYNEDGLLEEVSDSLGRKVKLSYTDQLLTEIIAADGSASRYEYDEEKRLTAFINAAGVKFLGNTYDEENRVVHQSFPDGTEMLYEYDDDHVTFTDRNGVVSVYYHDNLLRHTRTCYEQGEESYEYNDKNERITYTDLNGSVWKREFDNNGNVVSITDPLQNTTCYTYDDNGNLLSTATPDGAVTVMRYDEDGNMTEFADASGSVRRMSYEKGRVTEIIDADGVVRGFTYDDDGRLLSETDGRGFTEHYEYDVAGRLLRRIDRRSKIWEYEYDAKDRLVLVRNPLGEERKYVYTPIGKTSSITDFDGFTESWEYDDMGQAVTYYDKEGHKTAYAYDSMCNPSVITLADGCEIRQTFNNANLLERREIEGMADRCFVYDSYGRVTDEYNDDEERHFRYDSRGRLIEQTERDGRCTRAERDAMGRVVRREEPDGSYVTFAYDAVGRCISEKTDDGRSISYEYTPAGRMLSRTDAAGARVTYAYHANGRLARVNYADGTDASYEYDEDGNLIELRQSSGYTRFFEYDALNRRISIKDTDGRSKKLHYNAAGNVTKAVSSDGSEISYTYSPSGKLIKVTDELGQTTRYAYDSRGRMTALLKGAYTEEDAGEMLSDPMRFQIPDNTEHHLTSWTFTPAGQIKEVRNAVGAADCYEYDKYGRVVRHTDMDGNTLQYSYLPGGLTERIFDETQTAASYRYDAAARLTGMTDICGESAFSFNAGGNLTHAHGCFGSSVDYTFDVAGRTEAMTADGVQYRYCYDVPGRLCEISMDGSSVRYSYDKNGRLLKKEFPNNASEQYAYTESGQPKKIICSGADGEIYSCEYSYDIFGNISRKSEVRNGKADVSDYQYDALHRLIAANENGSNKTYRYDAFGNCVEITENGCSTQLRYNVLNQLIEKSQNGGIIATYAYDGRGNLIRETENGSTIRYYYNKMNQMTRVEGSNGTVTEYLWDGMGNRVGKISDSKTTCYVLDLSKKHHNVLSVKQGENRRSFLWDGKLLGENNNSENRWFFSNHIGSVTAATDSSGKMTDVFGYDAFGNSLSAFSHNHPGFGFAGMQYDSESSNYFAQRRMYSPRVGRFIGKDKERYIYTTIPESVNLYVYCRNNPLTFIDPEGNDCYIFYLPEWENEAIADQQALAQRYGYGTDQVHLIPIRSSADLTNGWNGMGTENGNPVDIDTVVINTHGDHEGLYGMRGNFYAEDIRNLDNQSMNELVLYGCNSGHMDYSGTNPAAEFAQRVDGAQVYASDGTVYSDSGSSDPHTYGSRNDDHFREQLINGDRDNLGWIEYRYVNGRIETRVVGDKEMYLTDMTDEMRRRRGTLCQS